MRAAQLDDDEDASATTASAKPADTGAARPPERGPSMIAYTSADKPMIDSSAPGTSSGDCSGSRDVGHEARAGDERDEQIGTFTQNTEPQ